MIWSRASAGRQPDRPSRYCDSESVLAHLATETSQGWGWYPASNSLAGGLFTPPTTTRQVLSLLDPFLMIFVLSRSSLQFATISSFTPPMWIRQDSCVLSYLHWQCEQANSCKLETGSRHYKTVTVISLFRNCNCNFIFFDFVILIQFEHDWDDSRWIMFITQANT